MDALLTAASTVAGVLVQIFDLAALSIGNASAALALTSYATGLCIPVVKEIDTFIHVRNNVIPHQPLEWLKATIQLRILNYTSDWRDGFVLQVLFVTETPFDLFPRFDTRCSSREECGFDALSTMLPVHLLYQRGDGIDAHRRSLPDLNERCQRSSNAGNAFKRTTGRCSGQSGSTRSATRRGSRPRKNRSPRSRLQRHPRHPRPPSGPHLRAGVAPSAGRRLS